MNPIQVKPLKEALPVPPSFDFRLFDIAGTSVTVATAVTFFVIILGTFLVSWFVQKALVRLFRASQAELPGSELQGTAGVFRRLFHYAILITGFGVALHTIGINLTGVFAAGAVFAVGLGLAMQNMAQNFLSGVILLLERSIKPGDVLDVEGQMVRVTRMAIRATHARTLDDEEIIVPNSTLVQSTVTNYTLTDSLVRVRADVGVSYGSDMGLVRKTLEEASGAIEWRATRKPAVLMTGFGSSSVDFEVSVWTEDPWSMRRQRSQLLEAMWFALKEVGITIAFPQLDVHFDPAAPPIAGGTPTGSLPS